MDLQGGMRIGFGRKKILSVEIYRVRVGMVMMIWWIECKLQGLGYKRGFGSGSGRWLKNRRENKKELEGGVVKGNGIATFCLFLWSSNLEFSNCPKSNDF